MQRGSKREPPPRRRLSAGRPAAVEMTGTASDASRTRSVCHAALGVLAWIALGAMWVWQLNTNVPDRWLEGVAAVVAIFVAWAVFTIGWVAWNRGIYRRRHQRDQAVVVEVEMDEDVLGRPVIGAREARDAAGQIVISVDAEGVKRYRRAGGKRDGSISALLGVAEDLREIVDMLPRR